MIIIDEIIKIIESWILPSISSLLRKGRPIQRKRTAPFWRVTGKQ